MRIGFLITGLFVVVVLNAQNGRKLTRNGYIETYQELAKEEMARTGIPASITLAQGILESGDGNSTLATKANNHFGIKCHDWKGPSVKHNDDAKNECFRKYKSAEHSYKDHSDFLTERSRYASLFELRQDDYKGWAKGLKKAGYATSPTYAKALIGVIEDNQLYAYDKEVLVSKGAYKKEAARSGSLLAGGRQVLFNNRVKYIVADSGDTYEILSEKLLLFSWQLPRYNESIPRVKLQQGDFVYIQPKRNRVYSGNKTHMVLEGETIHSISQLYAVKEEKLRQRNLMSDGSEPAPGAVLVLRGKLKGGNSPAVISEPKEVSGEEDKPEFEIEYDLGG